MDDRPELPPREPNTRPYGWGRISEEAAVVRNLDALGAVRLPRPQRRGPAGFSTEEAPGGAD